MLAESPKLLPCSRHFCQIYSITIMKWNKKVISSDYQGYCYTSVQWEPTLTISDVLCPPDGNRHLSVTAYILAWSECWTHYSRTQGLHNTSAVWRSGGCESTLRHNCRHISDVFITLGVLLLVLAAKLSQEITHKALAQQSTGGTFYCTVILPRLWKTTVL